MSVAASTRSYLHYARTLSRHWNRPFTPTLLRLLLSRLVYRRGPAEFDSMRFMEKPLRAWRTYTRDEDVRAAQRAVTPQEFRYLEEDKVAFAARCRDAGLPTPAIIAVTPSRSHPQDDAWGFPLARDARELAARLHARADTDGFAKPRRGGIGYGAFAFTVRDGAASTRDGTTDVHGLFERCVSSAQGAHGFVIQERVRAHQSIQRWMPPPGLGTIRVMTFAQSESGIAVPVARLKMPAPDADCDNLRFGSLVADVNPETGRLSPGVGATDACPVYRAYDRHPVTHAQITGEVIPFWSDVRSLVLRAASAFSELPVLGWDVAIADDGPVLIETNVDFNALERACELGQLELFRRLFAAVPGALSTQPAAAPPAPVARSSSPFR